MGAPHVNAGSAPCEGGGTIASMAVYLLTFHAYRSWREDRPEGYVQRGVPGVQPASEDLAWWRAQRAQAPVRRFQPAERRFLVSMAKEICANCGWRLYATSCTGSHVHVIIGWQNANTPDDDMARQIATRMKRVMGMKLGERAGVRGAKWFSRGCDLTRVKNRAHFDFLRGTYLPRHEREGGVVRVFDIDAHGDR